MSESIEDYIKKARTSGMNDQQIKDNLTKAGWLPDKIDPILAATSASAAGAGQPEQNPESPEAKPKQHFSITALPDKMMDYVWNMFRKVEK